MAERKIEAEAFAERDAKAKKRRALLFLAALVLALLFIEPEELDYQCPFQKYLDVYCPACGLTRAARSILHLQFGLAVRYNAYFALSLPFLVYACAAFLANAVSGKKILPQVTKRVWIIYFALFAAFGVLRNFEIFGFLAPPSQ